MKSSLLYWPIRLLMLLAAHKDAHRMPCFLFKHNLSSLDELRNNLFAEVADREQL